MTDFDVVVIGGGAAGFFSAIHAAAQGRNRVAILEKSNKLLSKVRVSGGGRCNVTHDCDFPSQLIKHYPRGGKRLRKGFDLFGPRETRKWFEDRGVELKVESDGRVFPTTDNSETIIECLTREARNSDVEIQLRTEVESVERRSGSFGLQIKGGETIKARRVIIATGGHAKTSTYDWLRKLELKVAEPIPSLFTFNVPDSDYKDLMGLSVPQAFVQIPGTKWRQDGPLLITHWGFSAPAVIKLSSWAAIDLHLRNYQFPILVNWCGMMEEEVRSHLNAFEQLNPKKLVRNKALLELPGRLWKRILDASGINDNDRYIDLGKKKKNRLVEMLVRHPFEVKGRTTFKEEFVTCGGVELSDVNLRTFEAKSISGLYLAGEVLNVDGVTGGFNFQHAWTSGYLAGSNAAAGQ